MIIRNNTRKSFRDCLKFISLTKVTRPSIVRNAMEDMEESVAEISAQLFHVLRGFYTAGQYCELWNVGLPESITGIIKDDQFDFFVRTVIFEHS